MGLANLPEFAMGSPGGVGVAERGGTFGWAGGEGWIPPAAVAGGAVGFNGAFIAGGGGSAGAATAWMMLDMLTAAVRRNN